MDDMRILVWMGACALVALLALTVIVAHVVMGRSLRERSQAACPYCHGRKMLTCDGGKVRVSYLPRSVAPGRCQARPWGSLGHSSSGSVPSVAGTWQGGGEGEDIPSAV